MVDGSVRGAGGSPARPRVREKTQALDGGSTGFSSWLLEGFARARFVTEPWSQSSALRSGLDCLLCRAVLAAAGVRGVRVRTGLSSRAVWTLPESKLPPVCTGSDDGSSSSLGCCLALLTQSRESPPWSSP